MLITDSKKEVAVLATSILITSLCAIVYQLLISSLSSYLLGSSILHFSLTIGCFMFFMGVGSFISRYYDESLIENFLYIEILIGFIGGLSGFILYLGFSLTEYYYLLAFTLIAVISTLIGLEIPLVTRFLETRGSLKGALSTILSVDYLGALFASLLFPLILLPYLGLMKTGFFVGALNISIAMYAATVFRPKLNRFIKLEIYGACALIILIAGFSYSNHFVGFFERFIYQDEIILTKQTPYQRIVLTKFKEDFRLYLNGNIQFSSLDEHRYHESLVHVPLSRISSKERILILGGGDGMALREVLKYQSVKEAVLVDLDPEIVELAKNHPVFRKLNKDSLENSKIRIVNKDAFKFLEEDSLSFSAIIIDLPDPNDLTLGKLYTKEFYEMLKRKLSPGGIVVTQSSSPYLAREAFWCINNTLGEVFEHVLPYKVYVPAFGPWGFNMAWNEGEKSEYKKIEVLSEFLQEDVVKAMFIFDSDMSEVPTEVNRLDNQSLVQYYEKSL